MAAEVWYRKWRPQTFADVSGQDHVTRTLARAVELGRVSHAYLFCGPRGTGKTSTARILAKAVNCASPEAGQPCTRCESCQAVAAGRALDLVEMDAASNRGIDEIRELRERVGYSTTGSRYKIYLIDEVHELTQFAFDALLKTLEEPPPHVIFVLATTERHKVPETILSRCQVYDFVRIKLAAVVGRLRQIAEAEGVQVDDTALALIARRATGSLRDAVNLFEQAVATQGHALSEVGLRAATGAGDARARELLQALIERRLDEALNLVAAVRDDGIDLRQFTRDCVQTLRAALLVRAGAAASLDLGDEAMAGLLALAGESGAGELARSLRLLMNADFRADPLSPLPLELAIIEAIERPAVEAAPPAVHEAAAARPQAGTGRAAGLAVALPAPAPAARVRAVQTPRTGPPPAPLVARRGEQPNPADPDTPRPAEKSVENPSAQPPGSAATAAAPQTEEPSAAVTAATKEPLTDAAPAAEVAEDALLDAPSAPASLDAVRRRMRELHTRVNAIDRNTAVLLKSACDIVSFNGTSLVLGFEHKPLAERAQRAAAMTALQQAAAELFGSQVVVSCVHEPDVVNRMQALLAERPSHLLDEALKLGARPLEKTT
ncbi:MAG TPA: DNA polymerase III subunit gamma/tau [Dehalococcoidia bacterium]|nr:DNA polymerase III subunit gamma/tau [Dehalococcoidia bacterium]